MSKIKKNTKNKGNRAAKGNSKNWFLEQQKPKVSDPIADGEKSKNAYHSMENLPIAKVQMKSNKEAQHFEKAYQFALENSDPNSQEIMTVHLDMNDEIHFNLLQDEVFLETWKKGELMCLVAFPKNWKTMTLVLDSEFEDEEDDFDLDSPEERFDYLYENGMSVYDGK